MQRLLTAAVDGELDYLERRALQRLLRESKEARHFYRELKRNARKVRDLARVSLPAHFSCEVLHSVGEMSRIVPSTFASVSKRADRFLPVWANIAAAAAVFLAISAGTYMVVVLSDQEPAAIAKKDKNVSKPEVIAAPKVLVDAPAVANNNSAKPDEGNKPEQLAALPHELTEPKAAVGSNATQDTAPLTRPFATSANPLTVEPFALPPPLAMRDLDQAQHRQRLLESLKKDDTFQIDLFCRDTAKGLDRVLAALRGQGVRIYIDAIAQERLNRKLKTCYALYIDSVTPEEVVKFAQSLAAEDRKADGQLDKFVTLKLSPESYKALGTLLGVEPKWLKEKVKVTGDPLKPLTDATAEKLAEKLAGKSGSAQPAGKPGQHHAVVVACDPPRPNPGASKEISLFLAARSDRKPGTVAVLLVLR